MNFEHVNLILIQEILSQTYLLLLFSFKKIIERSSKFSNAYIITFHVISLFKVNHLI
jgi:hypothetical protein